MNVSNILQVCDSAKKLVEHALKHVLEHLPEHEYTFDENPVRITQCDDFTGNLSDVDVFSVVLNEAGEIWLGYHQDEGEDGEGPLHEFPDGAYWILDHMEDLDDIPNYYDTPHTLLVYGEDECRQCQRLDHFDTEKTKSFINENEEEHILRRAFLTKQERDAYIMGADDAAYCYDTEWIQNDGRYDKENSIL